MDTKRPARENGTSQKGWTFQISKETILSNNIFHSGTVQDVHSSTIARGGTQTAVSKPEPQPDSQRPPRHRLEPYPPPLPAAREDAEYTEHSVSRDLSAEEREHAIALHKRYRREGRIDIESLLVAELSKPGLRTVRGAGVCSSIWDCSRWCRCSWWFRRRARCSSFRSPRAHRAHLWSGPVAPGRC